MKKRLAVLGIVCILPLTMAAECNTESPTPRQDKKSDTIGTVVRRQHQSPGQKDILIERWCIHVKRNDNGKTEFLCSVDKSKYYDKYPVGSKYPR